MGKIAPPPPHTHTHCITVLVNHKKVTNKIHFNLNKCKYKNYIDIFKIMSKAQQNDKKCTKIKMRAENIKKQNLFKILIKLQ